MSLGNRHFHARIALLLGLICLWLSSGATLHHTDDLSAFRTFMTGRITLGHPVPIASAQADACAACEWEQTVPTLHLFVVRIDTPSDILTEMRAALPDALHLRPFDHTSLRAPPGRLS